MKADAQNGQAERMKVPKTLWRKAFALTQCLLYCYMATKASYWNFVDGGWDIDIHSEMACLSQKIASSW
jgi:hypothetical protein